MREENVNYTQGENISKMIEYGGRLNKNVKVFLKKHNLWKRKDVVLANINGDLELGVDITKNGKWKGIVVDNQYVYNKKGKVVGERFVVTTNVTFYPIKGKPSVPSVGFEI